MKDPALRIRPVVLLAAVAATATAGSALGGTAALRTRAASPAALAAANQLIAQPWAGFVAQYQKQAQSLIQAYDGVRILNGGGNGWSFSANLENLNANLGLASPPGFISASPTQFELRAPVSGSWSFGVSGDVHAHAKVTALGRTVLDVDPRLHFALGVSGVSLRAFAQLDASDPTRPKLRSGGVEAAATLGGSGIFPGVSVSLSAQREPDGSLTFARNLTAFNVGFAGVTAKLTGSDYVRVLPYQTAVDKNLPGDAPDVHGALLWCTVGFKGSLSVRLPDPVGTKTLAVDAPLGFFVVPVPHEVADTLALLQGEIPKRWPLAGARTDPDGLPQWPQNPAVDLTSPRDTLEQGIQAHMPHGAVLTLDYKRDAKPGTRNYTYGLDADSTIWTGHYLTAEAFRYAVTGSQAALDRVNQAIKGLQHDFDVADVAVDGGKTVPVRERGLFARSTLPIDSNPGYTDGRYDKRAGECYYKHPQNGWTLPHSSKHYTTYNGALQSAKGNIGLRTVTPQPSGTMWLGFGCGSTGGDHPISRDQYSGLTMGLAYAWMLVPSARQAAADLLKPLLHYVIIDHKWNVPLPPTGRIITTFMGDFDSQLDLLKIAATIDPATYASRYLAAAPASELTWIPLWFSTVDPLSSYFKFNLGHAFMSPLLFLETDPSLRANYLQAYAILRASTITHRNAYFGAVDLLVGAAKQTDTSPANPALTMGSEVKADLADWVTRWKLVQNTAGMPMNVTTDTAANYLFSHVWAKNEAGLYKGIITTDQIGGEGWNATYALPLWLRTGEGMDFAWQKSPFGVGVAGPGSSQKWSGGSCAKAPPASSDQIKACSTEGSREGPGVDYLLPYWLDVYLKVLPAP